MVPRTVVIDMDTEALYRHWGSRVHARREAIDMTQRQLAAAVEVSQQTISNIEHGIRRPSDAVRVRIAAVLGVPVGELFPYEVAA